MNIVNGRLQRAAARRSSKPMAGCAGRSVRPRAPMGAVAYGVRPEHLSLAEGNGADAVPAEITVVEPTGAETGSSVQAGESQIVLVTHGRPQVNRGQDRLASTRQWYVRPGKRTAAFRISFRRACKIVSNNRSASHKHGKNLGASASPLRSTAWLAVDRDALVHRLDENQGIPHDQSTAAGDRHPQHRSQATPQRSRAGRARALALDAGGLTEFR
jgi:hypothetical protein